MISVGVECEHVCSKWNSICVRSKKVCRKCLYVQKVNVCVCRKWKFRSVKCESVCRKWIVVESETACVESEYYLCVGSECVLCECVSLKCE